MPATEIPPKRPLPQPPQLDGSDLYDAQRWETAYRDLHNVPALLIQLQDDLSRSRKREAFWISVVVHLVIVILLVNSEKLGRYFPVFRTISVNSSPNTLQNKDVTYLEQPPDLQKLTKKQNSDVISDKDRVATSRAPKLDAKELQKIIQAGRPGPPGETAPQQPPPVAAQNPPQQQQPQQPQQATEDNQSAALRLPQTQPKPSFDTGNLSAGSAVDQAAREALANPKRYGAGGDYGLGQGRQATKAVDQLEVLTDTMGVNFDPYLKRVVNDVRTNWYNLIPEAARAPLMKRGKVSIEFAILKDGRVAGLTLVSPSGDISLDRAAWGGITASNPFPPLPEEFRGQFLGLRFSFYYNQEPDLR